MRQDVGEVADEVREAAEFLDFLVQQNQLAEDLAGLGDITGTYIGDLALGGGVVGVCGLAEGDEDLFDAAWGGNKSLHDGGRRRGGRGRRGQVIRQ